MTTTAHPKARQATFLETYPNGVEAAARDTAPGTAEARLAVEQLKHLQPPQLAHIDNQWGIPSHAVAGHLVELASQGEEITPDRLLELARQAWIDQCAATVAADAVTAARDKAATHLASLVTDADLVTGYARAFELLVADLRSLEPLDQLADPAVAAAAGRMDDHQQYAALLSAYSDLRRRHRKLLGDGAPLQDPEAAVFVDITKVFKHWRAWRNHGHLVKRTQPDATPKPIPTPWPHVYDGDSRRTFDGDVDHPGFLLWAIDNDVPVRLATVQQYDREADRLKLARIAAPQQTAASSTDEWVDPSTIASGRGSNTRGS